MTAKTADVAVVGMGAVGCALAFELSSRGFTVLLIGRNPVAADASGKAWGGLTAHFGAGVPGPMLERYRKSTEMHCDLYARSVRELPDELDWQHQPVASLSLAMDESELPDLREETKWKSDNGIDAEVIDSQQVQELEPAITDDAIGGMLTDSGWELDCVRYARALVHMARSDGCLTADAEVGAIEQDDGGLTLTTADDGRYSVGNAVFATGPWCDGVAGVPALPIRPIKGEIIRLRRPGEDLRVRVGYAGRNVGRKPDGTVWVGTYEEDRGYDDSITDAGRDLILSGAIRYLPSLASDEIGMQTACLRPVSPDGLPIVGKVDDGVWVANGAGKKGVLLSLLMATMVADDIVDGSEPPDDVSPARFGL